MLHWRIFLAENVAISWRRRSIQYLHELRLSKFGKRAEYWPDRLADICESGLPLPHATHAASHFPTSLAKRGL